MNDDKLDQMERDAIDAITRIQQEYQRACEPYFRILASIRSIRPKVYVFDGQTYVPTLTDKVL